jgi:hypothetical protein
MGLLWLKLWAKDYLGDAKVRALSRDDRATLIDLWLLMLQAPRPGHLVGTHGPLEGEPLYRSLGLSKAAADRTLDELVRATIVRRASDGTLYSPRIVREAEEREQAVERQRRHRSQYELPCHGVVTSMSRAGPEARSQKEQDTAPHKGGSVLLPTRKPYTLNSAAGVIEIEKPADVPLWDDEEKKRLQNATADEVVEFCRRKGWKARFVPNGKSPN